MTENPQAETSRQRKIRERQQRRLEKRRVSRHLSGPATRSKRRRQIISPNALRLPKFRLPESRLVYVLPGGALLIVLVILALSSLSNREPETFPNAIWLDAGWTYAQRSDEELAAYTQNMKEGRIGTVYAYVSSMKLDGSWSGLPNGDDRFEEVQPLLRNFMDRFSELYPEANVLGWIEVQTDISNQNIRQRAADFSKQIVDEFGFGGVLLDVKPLWGNSENFLELLRNVRSEIGQATLLAVAVPPDLTPTNAGLSNPPQIAPNTIWEIDYKQSVGLQADQIVVAAYHSYRSSVDEYRKWVAYQVDAYNAAVADLGAEVMISIPFYDTDLPAHNAVVENLSTALDAIREAVNEIPDDFRSVAGVAIYADRDLSGDDWREFNEKQIRN